MFLIVMYVSAAEFGRCVEDFKDREDDEVDSFMYKKDWIGRANAIVHRWHCCSVSQTRCITIIIIWSLSSNAL